MRDTTPVSKLNRVPFLPYRLASALLKKNVEVVPFEHCTESVFGPASARLSYHEALVTRVPSGNCKKSAVPSEGFRYSNLQYQPWTS